MADGALNARRSGFEGLCDRRIEKLRDGIHNLIVVDREDYRLAQILIALYVRGHADAVHYLGDGDLKAVVLRGKSNYVSLRRGGKPGQLFYPLCEYLRVKGLNKIVVCAALRYLLLKTRIRVRRGHEHQRARLKVHVGKSAEHAYRVRALHESVHDEHVRSASLPEKAEYLRAVLSDCFDFKAVCPQCRCAARLSVRVLCKHDF